MTTVYLGVGSNLGDRAHNLQQAQKFLKQIQGLRFLRASSIAETESVGGPPQGKYLNAVWKIETTLEPEKLLEQLHGVERSLGRVRKERNEPRSIDLDILSYGQRVFLEPALKIPHPRLKDRRFVLEPLNEIAPEWIHPVTHQTAQQMLQSYDANTHKPELASK